MKKLLLRDQLVEKINLFNKIFELDFINNNDDRKGWKNYLDPIAKRIANVSYLTFMKENHLELNTFPGAFQAYYNLFSLIIDDLKTMISLPVPNEIYCAALDVMETFDEFLYLNKFKVDVDRMDNVKKFFIYPTI